MAPANSLSLHGRTYVVGVIATGTLAVAAALAQLTAHPPNPWWFLFAALTVISGSATVKLPSIPASLSVSETFVFISVLLYGSAAGTLTVALDGLIISFWLNKQRKEVHRVLFNMAAPALAMWIASQLFFSMYGHLPLSQESATIDKFLFPLLVFTVVYFGLNSWLIAFAVAAETQAAAFDVWKNNFLWLSLNFICGASVATLLTAFNVDIKAHPSQLGMYVGAILPLLFVLYMTYRTSMARVEDANKHLTQVNALYLSTIETLAMAIDAKDQVTHGHIRRVQAFATGLARALGVADGTTLHAVEAASLLHDMGKLAIPEHILNKPGRLTPSEFERMKLHAAIGADILSAIEFPYPVVPIVRHHHENWDGTGYPDGLSGTDIPVGARILSVVDCYDALTSDRPYRPALSNDDAIQILLERRGSMYDPLVVDTFVRVHNSIGPDLHAFKQTPQVITDIAKSISVPQLDVDTAGMLALGDQSERLLIFASLLSNIPGHVGSADIAELSWYHLRQMMPVTSLGVFAYDKATDEIVCTSLVEPSGPLPLRMRRPVGQGLSGWVAASKQAIINSDPRLDLGDAAVNVVCPLRSAISVPLLIDEQLVGVLTLYSELTAAYNEHHLELLNILGPRLANALERSRQFDEETGTQLWDASTGLPNDRHLRQYLSGLAGRGLNSETSFLLVSVDCDKAQLGTKAELALRGAAQAIKSSLRLGDLLFRLQDDEILCVLHGADAMTAHLVLLRVTEALSLGLLDQFEGLAVSSGVSTPPADGLNLDELVRSARSRLVPVNSGLITAPRPI